MSSNYWGEDYNDSAVKKVRVEDAVGTLLAHDVTEIRPGEFKGTAFSAGHKINKEDLSHFKRIGKNHIFVLDLNHDQIHENHAVLKLARTMLGPGISFESDPKEGKIQLKSTRPGLFKINTEALFKLNMIPEIMCASIHSNIGVEENTVLAAVRVMPLFVKSLILDQATSIVHSCEKHMFEVKPFLPLRVRLIITGNEIYEGLVNDGFEAIIRAKLENYGFDLLETVILPDNVEQITHVIKNFLGKGMDLLITTGGMSVDPDDVTRHAILKAGADKIYYGAAVIPGAMFQLAYFREVAAVGIPACALYHKATVFDLVLPRLLTGEKLNARDLASFAHGGMCLNCTKCTYPRCSFGKN